MFPGHTLRVGDPVFFTAGVTAAGGTFVQERQVGRFGPALQCGEFLAVVGLDAKDGKVAVDGWSKMTGHDVIDLAKKFEDYGVESVIYTDIGRDGMLSGVNIEATVRLAQALRIPVIASGGIGCLADIDALCAVEDEGITGAITGRAIYEGKLDFKLAQERADELREG